jgi:hypothetical protein
VAGYKRSRSRYEESVAKAKSEKKVGRRTAEELPSPAEDTPDKGAGQQNTNKKKGSGGGPDKPSGGGGARGQGKKSKKKRKSSRTGGAVV